MLRRLYDWTLNFARRRHAHMALVSVSFAESSFFPIPPDVLLVPMVLANRDRAYIYATSCTLASVIGGIFGYAIGALLYESVGLWLIKLYGYGEQVDHFRRLYSDWGAWIILLKGLTPIPFKVVTLTSGFAGYDFLYFVILSAITRALRFFPVVWLLVHYGESIRGFIERRLELVTMLMLIIIVGGFVLVRYVV